MDNVVNIIEAILFAVGRPVCKDELRNTLDLDLKEIDQAIELLEKEYSNNTKGIVFTKIEDEYQFVSNKKYFDQVSKFVENTKKETLSTTCLEVLSIIAYNTNITKTEIENIRGVNSDSQVSRLLEYGLIEELGRLKLPGRPAVFGVTKEFLKCMGINFLEELPDYEKINNMRKDIKNPFESEMSLSESEEELK